MIVEKELKGCWFLCNIIVSNKLKVLRFVSLLDWIAMTGHVSVFVSLTVSYNNWLFASAFISRLARIMLTLVLDVLP